ncbi:MAG: enoyl-CoA hydratase/isomerase family protein [Anaerolineales bacterium]|nr:enoyl-CoA hydratase/isomerase family protein [Anaerolineales bacterium]
MAYQNWNVREEGQITTLELYRPDHSNNLTAETLYELSEITDRLRADPDVRSVILQGQGEHFSTGVDLRMVKERLGYSEKDNRRFLLGLQVCLDNFESLEVPTIAKLRGFCIGGGLLLALCCDFRYASERTIFSLPEVKLGFPILWGTQRITRVIGFAAAKEMILLGGRFKAAEALSCGLVHRVVQANDLDAEVAAFAMRFMKLSPRVLRLAKRVINTGIELTLRESQDLEVEILTEVLASPETRDTFAHYLETHEPSSDVL